MPVRIYNSSGRRAVLLNDATAPRTACLILPFHYLFRARTGDPPWNETEAGQWVDTFERHAEQTWSHCWIVRGSRNDRDTWPCRRVPEFARAWTGVCSGTHTLDVDVSVDARTVSARPEGGRVFEADGPGAAFCREHRLLVFSVNVWHRRADGGDSMGAVQERGDRGVIQLPQDGVALRRPLPGDPRTEGIEQRASDHEVGHALGQEHPLCETNQLECYGVPGDQSQPLAPEAETLMGIGRRVSTRDYAPFATMMAAVVTDYRWSVVAEPPGTPGDVRAGVPCASPFRRPSLYPTSVRQRA